MKPYTYFIASCLLLLPYFGQAQLNSQKYRIASVELLYDEHMKLQFVDEFPLDLRVIYERKSDGKQKVKVIRNNHTLAKKFSIESRYGRYHEGEFYYRRKEVFNNGGNIDLRIRDKLGSGFSQHLQIPVPNLEAIELSYDDSQVGPGKKIPLYLNLVYDDGWTYNMYDKSWSSSLKNEYLPKLSDIRIQSSEQALIEKRRDEGLGGGIFLLARKKPRLFLVPDINCPPRIEVGATLKDYPGIIGEVSIPMTYNASYTYYFNGKHGGYRNIHAKPVDIFVKKIRHHDRELIWVKVQNANKSEETFLDPRFGSIQVFCRGGDGFDGSDGTDGADGSEDPPAPGCNGGAGEDGDDGGHGATVTFHTDRESESYLSYIHIDNSGGRGGDGGDGGDGGEGGGDKPDGCDGTDGSDGSPGRNGPPPKTKILDSQELLTLLKNSQTPKER